MTEQKNHHRRPLEVSIVVLIALVAVVVYLVRASLVFDNLGMFETGIPSGLFQGYVITEIESQAATGFYYLLVCCTALIIAIGLLRMRRWSWVAFMMWAGFNLIVGLLRLLYSASKSNYLYLFLSVVVVFILNQAEIQQVFGIRREEEEEDLEDEE
jgi:hypothetical protein